MTPAATEVIAGLDVLDRNGLLQAWTKAFGSPPVKGLSPSFMRKALAHEAQCRQFGGLPAETRRLLRSMAAGKPAPKQTVGGMAAGAHLVREWNGRTYQVEVIDGGYRFDGRMYASLSAIAKRITGAHWSGPRFFGLTTRGAA